MYIKGLVLRRQCLKPTASVVDRVARLVAVHSSIVACEVRAGHLEYQASSGNILLTKVNEAIIWQQQWLLGQTVAIAQHLSVGDLNKRLPA